MRTYIIRRLMLMIPTLFILTILVFLSVRFIPGDVIDVMLGKDEFIGREIDREALEHMLGLDVPVHVQYGRWIGVLPPPDWITGESHFIGLLQGNLGHSGERPIRRPTRGRSSRPTSEALAKRRGAASRRAPTGSPNPQSH